MTILRLLVTGGGTGGHLFPGIAVAEEVLSRMPESEVLFIGTSRKVDAAALSGRRFQVAILKSSPIKGKSLAARLAAILRLPISIWNAMVMIRRFKPDVALGVGGYVTGPVILAARLLGVKTCIHEQNSVPGMANRLLGKFVDKIFVTFPGSEKFFPTAKTILTGNPVRKEILDTMDSSFPPGGETVLAVLGGSQGAHRVNVLVTEALSLLGARLPQGFKVIHQTGSSDKGWVSDAYRQQAINAVVSDFFTNMEDIYQEADFIISRAGATTLAEITVLAKPSILIPYPYAADGHQEENGRYLIENGAAVMLLEEDLSGVKLADQIMELLNNPESRKRMGIAAGQLARPDATGAIVDECLALAA